MEGENYPYFFDASSSFSLNNNTPLDVVDHSMQNPDHHLHDHQFPCSDQIDLAGFLGAGSLEQNPVPPLPGGSIGDVENVCRNKGKVGKKKKYVPPRVAFHTRSAEDILDDGYKWRKYGQKSVKNSVHPRSYYRCTHHTCNVKKQIQRLSKDTSIVVTTYEGIHNHPCEKLMETLSPLLRQLQFLSRF
ncbi:probable WRKY transcription factor 43 [Sesamum indicum]|uniref:Probable WRKY transcription factor 43 n=1 Tax=Sesamum indicum TaxID=4182 RepID=A0A6I9TC19_SESIN|nr:probable WRKY transcription factor 43 [Sesamum indicum]